MARGNDDPDRMRPRPPRPLAKEGALGPPPPPPPPPVPPPTRTAQPNSELVDTPSPSPGFSIQAEPRTFGRAKKTKPDRQAAAKSTRESATARSPRKPIDPRLVGTPQGIDAEPVDPLEQQDLKTTAIKSAPAWLVSFVFHTLLIIVLALVYVGREVAQTIALNVTYAETLGAQLDNEQLAGSSFDAQDIQDPALAIDVNPSDDPLARPPDLQPRPDGYLASDRLPSVSIGLALSGREAGMKRALLAKYGGTALTKAAVARALEWLKRNQRRDGTWSLTGPYANGGRNENKTSATAMALIAFQGDGHTHLEGEYQQQVATGSRALLKMQDEDGNFYQGGDDEERLYSHAQAMIAICELYGMTQDSALRGPAQLAVDYAVKIQAPEGGWRYIPGNDSDTSVTGWFVMGLQSALMAGLEVPSPTLQRISEFLDSVAIDEGAFYKYHRQRQGFTPAMTAEGLLCRQYLGWKQDDRRLADGASFLLEHKVDYTDYDVYYWYYATQVLHHLEGESWEQWNRVMRQAVPDRQVKSGKEEGSWDPQGERWSNYGGRLYVTCFSTYMLEVYYRHLPIYSYRPE